MSSGMPLGRDRPFVGQALGSFLGLRDAQLNLTDGGQVFIDLAPVVHAKSLLELLGIVQDKVQDALLIQFSLDPIGGRTLHAIVEAKSRSKTSFGLISLAIGMFADLHEMFEE